MKSHTQGYTLKHSIESLIEATNKPNRTFKANRRFLCETKSVEFLFIECVDVWMPQMKVKPKIAASKIFNSIQMLLSNQLIVIRLTNQVLKSE